jgi:hypothetical protein
VGSKRGLAREGDILVAQVPEVRLIQNVGLPVVQISKSDKRNEAENILKTKDWKLELL